MNDTKPSRLTLGRHPLDSVRSFRRRRVLNSARLPVPDVALELGAFDNPTLRASDGFTVRYADYLSTEQMLATWKDHPGHAASRIVPVDYVVKGATVSPFIPDRVDLVVANHVIEHICNPIGWLCDIASICTERGAVFLAVPDQRYTFDYHKRPTDITALVQAYEEGKNEPDLWDVARMIHLHVPVDAGSLWAGGEAPAKPGLAGRSFREILERARERLHKGRADVHSHFYTAASFVHVFAELARSDYIPWSVELLSDVEPGANEFCVLLRRRQPPG